MAKDPTFYDILEVQPNADYNTIRNAYKNQMLKWHPDVSKGDPNAEAETKRIAEAYATLSDPAKRAEYDKQIGSSSQLAQKTGTAIVKGGKGIVDLIDKFTSYEPLQRVVARSAQNQSPDYEGVFNTIDRAKQTFGNNQPSQAGKSKAKPKPKKKQSEAMKALNLRFAKGDINEKTYKAAKEAMGE